MVKTVTGRRHIYRNSDLSLLIRKNWEVCVNMRVRVSTLLCIAAAILVLCSMLAGAQATTVRYTNWLTADEADTMQMIISRFEELHPDIKVEYDPMAWPGVTGYLEQIVVWSIADSLPDVMNIPYVGLPQLVRQGLLVDLDPYMEKDADEVDRDDFIEIAIDASSYDGRLYGLPFDFSIWTVNLNLDLFDKVGVVNPLELHARGEWNWNTMSNAAAKLTEKTAEGEWERVGLFTFTGDAGLFPWIWGTGGRLYNKDLTKCTINHPATLEGLSYLHGQLFETGNFALVNWQQPTGVDLGRVIGDGSFGMQPWWNTLVGYYCSQGVTWQCDQVPFPPGPVDEVTNASQIHSVSVMSQSENPDAAWEYVKFLTGKIGYKYVIDCMNFAPIRKSLLPDYVEMTRKMGMKGAEFFFEGVGRTRVMPRLNEFSEIDRIISENLAPVWRNEKGLTTAASEIARLVNQILGEAK